MIRHGKPDATGTATEYYRVGYRVVTLAVLVLLFTMRLAENTKAFSVAAFDGQVTADAASAPFTQAGGHPFKVSTQIDFETQEHPFYGTWPSEPVRDIVVELPPGLVGNPVGIPRCRLAQLAPDPFEVRGLLCPAGSQIGMAEVTLAFGVRGRAPQVVSGIPVFNMVPPPDVPARFGMSIAGVIVALDASLRSAGDYGLSINVRSASQGLPLIGTRLTFWGTPSAPEHRSERGCPNSELPINGGPTCDAEGPNEPLLRLPTACTEPGTGVETFLHVASWFNPGAYNEDGSPDLADPSWKSASFVSHLLPGYPLPPEQWGAPVGITGCDVVPFNATLDTNPMDPRAGMGSGYAFDLTVPQGDDPATGIAPSDLKTVRVTLPVGVRVSPSAANGLDACSADEIGLLGTEFPAPNPIRFTTDDPTCPDASRVGSLTIETPLLEEELTGAIYLATPRSNPFGTLLAIYLVAEGPGLLVKLPGKIETDPATGQVTATFDNNPQLPFANLHLEFNGGQRAQLVNPPECGEYTTWSEFTSWSGKTVVSETRFTLSSDGQGAPCPARGFAPSFRAGTDTTDAGDHTTFRMSLERGDGEQELAGLSLNMPKGLLARIKDVPLCPEAQAAAGTCGEASQIGTVLTAAGPGIYPYVLGGKIFLGGAYRDAPFGLSIVVPAIAGPFDLGTVVVRAAIHVDPETAALRIISDPLPTILEGIPLQVRIVRIRIERDGFMINPTNCSTQQVGGTIASTSGATAQVSSRFQVGNCAGLPMKPKMRLTVGSRGRTQQGRSTPFTARLTQTPGQTNLRSVRVTLPTTINALLDVVSRACTRAEFDANRCAARTGSAVAVTPLLRDPLRGSAYFVRNPARPIPDIVVALRGEVDVNLTGHVSIPGGKRLSTTFATIPDVPITSFELRLVAGRNGAVGIARNLCTRSARRSLASVVFTGQNGRVKRVDKRLDIRGCGSRGRGGRRRRR